MNKKPKRILNTGLLLAALISPIAGLSLLNDALAARPSLSDLNNKVDELQNEDQTLSGQLVIERALMIGVDQLRIVVANLGSGMPEVSLSGVALVVINTLVNSDGTSTIVAQTPGIGPGSYLLTVSSGSERSQFDAFEITLGAVGPKGDKGDPGTSSSSRIVSFEHERVASCSYNCSSTRGYPECSCRCTTDIFRSCTCSCSSTASTSCTAGNCTPPPNGVTCPDIGGTQGQTSLAICILGSYTKDNSCSGTTAGAVGPIVECSSSNTNSCSCGCSTGLPFTNCSCRCQPSGTVSCTSPTRSASRVTSRALCLKVE